MAIYIFSQFLHRPLRALGVIGGVALGAALFVALTALGNGFRQAAQAPLAGVAADLLITRPSDGEPAAAQRTRGPRLPFGSNPFQADEVNQIKKVAGITQIAVALEVWDFGANQYQVVLGVNSGQNQVGPGRVLQEGLVSGRIFEPDEPGVAVADRHYAALFSLKPGDTVTIGDRNFQVVGIVDQQGSNQAGAANLYLPLVEAQQLVNMPPGQVNQIYARLDDAGRLDTIVADLTTQLGTISAMSQESILQVMGGVARISTKFSAVAGLVGLIGGGLLAWAALAGLVAERRREIGVMKAIGWRSREVIRVFMGEIFLLSLLGGLLGAGLGLGLALAMSYLPAPTMLVHETLPGLTVAVSPTETSRLPAQVTLSTLVLAQLVAAGSAMAAGWFSVRRAANLKPCMTFDFGPGQ
jgi:putative ABC transport system permease protein